MGVLIRSDSAIGRRKLIAHAIGATAIEFGRALAQMKNALLIAGSTRLRGDELVRLSRLDIARHLMKLNGLGQVFRAPLHGRLKCSGPCCLMRNRDRGCPR